jgi:hypothetical protein
MHNVIESLRHDLAEQPVGWDPEVNDPVSPQASMHLWNRMMDTAITEHLCVTYATDVESLHTLGVYEACQILLCASDLKLESPILSEAIERLAREEPEPSDQSEDLLQAILRQLVYTRFGVCFGSRKRFLDFWVNDKNFRGKGIIGVSFLIDLSIENMELLQPKLQEYVAHWYLSHSELRSDRGRAWAIYGLVKVGHEEVAAARASQFMQERDRNGSWGGDFQKTVACSYPLILSGLFAPNEFERTASYIFDKLHLGYVYSLSVRVSVLKLLYLLGQIPDGQVRSLRARVRSLPLFANLSDAEMAALRRKITSHFGLEELRTLCFDIGINHDDFPDHLDAFSRELVSYCSRRHLVPKLVEACKRERPQVLWP